MGVAGKKRDLLNENEDVFCEISLERMIDTMKKKLLWIGGGASLLLLCILIGAFVAGPLIASASSATPSASATTSSTTSNPYCQQYLQALAQQLNVPVATLEKDQKTAKEDVLAQLVKDGKLTQAQADAIKQRIESRQPCSGKGRAWWDHGILRQTLKQYKSTLLNGVASGLHMSASQLQADLQNGQTLAQIANAQKISESQLHTVVLNAVQNTLTQARQAGKITQSQEDAFMQYLQKHPAVVNHWLHHTFAKK